MEFTDYILNPLYTGLVLYTVVMLLVMFCFQSFEMRCSEHIKFFIYNFTILTIFTIYYKRTLEKHFKQVHNLEEKNLKIVENVHSSNANSTLSPSTSPAIDVLLPSQ